MFGSFHARRALAVVILLAAVAPGYAQEREEFTNLKVLPKNIDPADLRAQMNGFTRALGVRCIYCHVGEEGKPFQHGDFAKDDKPTKRKTRDMLRMVSAINDDYLGKLESRSDPPVKVQCATCHRGAPQPRMLEDVLAAAYQQGGIDSTLARYQALRDKYYGRATYDFGEVPLVEVAHRIGDQHADDASRLLALNVAQNPKSAFAKREHAAGAILQSFRTAGSDSGAATYRRMLADYGPNIVSEGLLNDVGYRLMNDHVEQAIAVLKLNAAEHPASGNAYDSLGEAYMQHHDWKPAKQAYTKALALDPTNDNAKNMLKEIETASKKK